MYLNITEIDITNVPGPYKVDSGALVAIPFTIGENEAIEIDIVQASLTQDHSMRVRISHVPNGMPVKYNPPNSSSWHPNYTSSEKVVVYDEVNLTQPPVS